ncbi:acyl-CoA N-acyltransferase [Fusarium tricinctum]|uniref:Acyl-CoA N-acyltransferase n=2 Tax=Fusarium tricinctum species complex TaxID=679429 RepID=A0A8K0S9K1_9HYPO|nr:acyl-CoA N-acyltransferase [Fusarium tricinctum]
MATTQILHRIRPGTTADITAATNLYMQSFDKEKLLDFMFPSRHTDSTPFRMWIARRFLLRYWTPGYVLTMLDDPKGRPVAFTWWHIPDESLSLRQRWLSLHAWMTPIVRAVLKLHSFLFPIRGVDDHRLGIYDRVFSTIEPNVLNSPRRRSAWYLSSLGVSPDVQGAGYGSLLLQHGLEAADRAGVPTWLVGLRGLDNFYNRFGFVEVARANIGELKDWDGGVIMFRGE